MLCAYRPPPMDARGLARQTLDAAVVLATVQALQDAWTESRPRPPVLTLQGAGQLLASAQPPATSDAPPTPTPVFPVAVGIRRRQSARAGKCLFFVVLRLSPCQRPARRGRSLGLWAVPWPARSAPTQGPTRFCEAERKRTRPAASRRRPDTRPCPTSLLNPCRHRYVVSTVPRVGIVRALTGSGGRGWGFFAGDTHTGRNRPRVSCRASRCRSSARTPSLSFSRATARWR